MSIIFCLFSAMAVSTLLFSLYVFHNSFIEVMPFSFSSSIRKVLFFFFGYFGLLILSLFWGVGFFLFYLSLDYLLFLPLFYSGIYFLLFFIFALCFIIFFIEAVNYQFTLSSYWYGESSLLFFISKCFGVLFLISSFFALPFFISLSFPSLIDGSFFNFLVVLFFSLLYFIWLVSFANHFVFNKSFFIC